MGSPEIGRIPEGVNSVSKETHFTGIKTIESVVNGKKYEVKGRLVVPEKGDNKTLILLLHGAAAPPIDPLVDAAFYQDTWQKAGLASFTYNAVGVGSTKSTTSGDNEEFGQFSITNRVDEAINVIKHIVESDEFPYQNVVVAGVSTGAHVILKALDRLKKQEPEEAYAKKFLQRVKGMVFIGGGAFLPEVEDLPPVSTVETPEEDTRQYKLQHTNNDDLPKSEIFTYLQELRDKGMLPPVITLYGEKDTMIPHQVKTAYRSFSDEDYVVNGQGHPLLSSKVPDQTRETIAQKVAHFVTRIPQSPLQTL